MTAIDEQAGLERLGEMVAMAQRGDLDLGEIQLSEISRELRDRVLQPSGELDLLWAAESLQLLTKLLEMKMGRRLDELSDERLAPPVLVEEDSDPGARLEEYRMFKAAAGVLLSDANAGPRAFLRVLGVPVQPRATLSLSPEALASAFGELLARLPEADELQFTLPRYSVDDKVAELRQLLKTSGQLRFDEVFVAARDRMEAVALFLALLELVWSGQASCTQEGVNGPILVESSDGG